MKITPAHDQNDYEIGMRCKLPFLNIFTDDGVVNEQGGQFKVRYYDHSATTLQSNLIGNETFSRAHRRSRRSEREGIVSRDEGQSHGCADVQPIERHH